MTISQKNLSGVSTVIKEGQSNMIFSEDLPDV